MSSKYEKFDDSDFGVLPVEHQNVSAMKNKNGGMKLSPSSSQSPYFSPDTTDTASVEIITPNGKSETFDKRTTDFEGAISNIPSSYNEFPESLEEATPVQRTLRRYLEHMLFRLFSMLLILIDCTLLVADLSNPHKHPEQQDIYDLFAFLFACYFCIEITLRIYARGVTNFFSDWYNSVDFTIIVLSILVTIAYTLIDVTGSIKLVALGRLIRVFILLRLIRAVYTEPKHLQRGVRNVVSENKRRFRVGRFDLDLTYIQPRIIAMSFPSSGRMALYRNHIKDVSEYLDERHGAGRYRVYNLCAEKSYDTTFFHQQVCRFEIDDHNVPSLQQMVDFVKDARDFLQQSPEHIVAIHCKGGKGRTGTMICALLLYLRIVSSAEHALQLFGDRRTDRSMASKCQGVETPSQARYVRYFARVLGLSENEEIPQALATLPVMTENSLLNPPNITLPNPRRLSLQQLQIVALIGVGIGDGSDLRCKIDVDRGEEQFQMDFGTCLNCDPRYNGEQDALSVTPLNCPPLVGDVRIRFYCKSRKVPKGYEACSFYFWFNTAFLEKEDQITLKLNRTQLDNPHKSSTWNVFRQRFAVVLSLKSEQA